MKKVYDACTRWWGIGAILFGINSLFKHILILLAVCVVLVIIGLIVSIWVPPLLPFVFNILKAIGSVIGMILGLIGRGISALIGLFQKKT